MAKDSRKIVIRNIDVKVQTISSLYSYIIVSVSNRAFLFYVGRDKSLILFEHTISPVFGRA